MQQDSAWKQKRKRVWDLSSSVSSLGSSVLRLSGLNSGLDTDSIVKQLLSIDQLKIDSQFQKKEKLEWKLDAYREIKADLKNFTQKYMSVLSSDNLWSASALKTYDVTLSGTNTSAVSVSAGSGAQAGTITIDSITRLAEAAHADSSTGVATGDGLTGFNVALKDLALTTPLTFEDGKISFSINGKEFSFSKDDTLQTMMNTVNNDSDVNVTLSYSQLTNAFSLKTDKTGSTTSLSVVNLTGNAFGDGETSGALGLDAGTYSNGKDALLSIDGVSVTRSSNTFTIDGVTYSLRKTSSSAIDATVAQDVDAAVDKIKKFIDDYNTLIEKYNGKLTEKTYSDYAPLTDAQREEMSDTEITSWETKAKSGILRSDSDITSLLSTFRSAFSTAVGDTGKTLFDIGLKTGDYTDNGKIELDETKLREALTENPDEVVQLFTNSSKSTGSAKFSESGLMPRISDAINTYLNSVQSVSVEHTEKEITSIEEKMDELEDIMNDNQERYYARFTAMEQAIATMNSQSTWLNSLSGSSS